MARHSRSRLGNLCRRVRGRSGRAAEKNTMNYHEAMFAHTGEPLSDAEQLFFSERIAFHEAGHAVVGYALGFGCSRIEMRETYKVAEKLIYPGGAYLMTRVSAERLSAKFRRGVYHPLLAKSAIMSAAGVASELRYCREVQVPARTLGASNGDHEAIDAIAKRIEVIGGRSRFAFCELAWRGAQKTINNPVIWSAIAELAGVLNDEYCDEVDTPHDYSSFCVFKGSTVRMILRRAGVRLRKPGPQSSAAATIAVEDLNAENDE